MNITKTRKTIAALLCGGLLAATGAAHAHGGDRWDDRGGRSYQKHHKHYKHYKHYTHHHKHARGGPRVIRETVVVRERPRYYREREVHYYERPVRYSRSPAIVVGVDIPPLVFPLR